MPHPAFVLYNLPKTVIVVPTSSDDGPELSPPLQKALIKCPRDGQVFPKDTLLNLHQIRAISKNRIISDLKCSAQQYTVPNSSIDDFNNHIGKNFIDYGIDLKQCIELKLAYLYAPDVFFKMFRYKKELEEFKKENNKLRKVVKKLKLDNENLIKSNKKSS